MSITKTVIEHNRSVRIVDSSDRRSFITENDAEMDTRAVQAVKAAISKAKICKKPVAKYDPKTKTAYIEYPDGRKVNVE